jgi:putative spermidine/putrescine transport system permease protein
MVPMTQAVDAGRYREASRRRDLTLLGPAAALFVVILLVPIVVMFIESFNPSVRGVATLSTNFSLDNYLHALSAGLYTDALIKSMLFGIVTAVVALVLGYPIAFIMANSNDLRVATIFTILLLIPFQLDVVVRILGLVVLLGDNGLINQALTSAGAAPLHLMYNEFGVIVGTTEFMLPFVVFSLVGVMRTIDPDLLPAARSLGLPYWRSFWKVVLPLSVPGIIAAALIAFTLTVSNYIVPVLMSSYTSLVLSGLMHEQVVVVADFRFAAALGVMLLAVSIVTIAVAYRVVRNLLELV